MADIETLAALIKRELPCRCAPPYPWPRSGRTDPTCPWHSCGEGLAETITNEGWHR